MGKNLNTQVWTLDGNGYTQTVSELFTTTPPVYTHANHIDNSFNFCVNGVNEQKKRAVFYMTDRGNNTYSLEDIDCTFIPDAIYDNRGNIGSQSIGVALGVNGGVSNFTMAPDDLNQPPADFKILVNFTYLSTVWAPRINIRTYDHESHYIGSDHYMTLNQLDAESTAEDAEEGETWWEYYKRNEVNYIITMDRYNPGQYQSTGAFQSMSVFEGQTRAGLSAPRVSWLNTPRTSGNTNGTSGCYIFHGNGRDRYDDMTFDVLLSMPVSMLVKKDEWDDTPYSGYTRHNVLYCAKIDRELILRIIASYGLPFSFSNTTNISIGHEDYALPEVKNNTTTGNWFRGADAITADTDNNRWANTKDIDNKPAGGGGGGGGDAEAETFGWGGNEVAGMVRYYLLSKSEMESLQAFMSDPNWRMDYRNCVIGMYVVPNGGLFFDAPVATTLKFRIGLNETGGAIPQDQELDTGISCLRISGVVNNDSAVIELPRINGNFLDFEPYSKYMVYVPFCGVIPLPDYVAGKEIKITIYPDVPTCTCTAVVTSEDRKIATAKGAFGSQLPLTSDGDGLKAASVINSLGNFIMGAGEVALGIGTGMVPLAIAGGAQMLGSGLQTDLQLGQAFGYSIGASGDTSFFGAGTRCEYFVAYSKWNNPDVDEGELHTNIYGHTYGFVCNKRGLLKDFDGFTVCDNPHVYGFSCTSDEKDEIERLLREGIIIHKPEE